ncbi:winged helix DNA-binding domain-containing protein [Brevibacterium casei]|nr:winged helix DNA-binding domain-containing protein [Brevibacterium casei]
MDSAQISAARMISSGLVGSDALTPAEAVRRLACVQAQALGGALVSVARARRPGTSPRCARRSSPDRSCARGPSAARSTSRLPRTSGGSSASPRRGGGRPKPPGGPTSASTNRRSRPPPPSWRRPSPTAARSAGEDLVASLAPLMTGISEDEEYGRRRHLITNLSMQGLLIQSGFVPGRDELAFALRDPSADAGIDTEAALREWMRRYVLGHGPVTVDDAPRWTGLPKTPIRAALASLVDSGDIAAVTIDDVEHVQAPDLEDRLSVWEDTAHALTLFAAGFDELILGYKDRRTLDPGHERAVVPGGNGMFKNTVVEGTRVRGTWKRSPKKSGPRVLVDPSRGRRSTRSESTPSRAPIRRSSESSSESSFKEEQAHAHRDHRQPGPRPDAPRPPSPRRSAHRTRHPIPHHLDDPGGPRVTAGAGPRRLGRRGGRPPRRGRHPPIRRPYPRDRRVSRPRRPHGHSQCLLPRVRPPHGTVRSGAVRGLPPRSRRPGRRPRLGRRVPRRLGHRPARALPLAGGHRRRCPRRRRPRPRVGAARLCERRAFALFAPYRQRASTARNSRSGRSWPPRRGVPQVPSRSSPAPRR